MFAPNGVDPTVVAAAAPGGRSPCRVLVDLHDAGLIDAPGEQAALPTWSAVHGLAHLALDGRVTDVDAAIEAVLRFTLRGLGAAWRRACSTAVGWPVRFASYE